MRIVPERTAERHGGGDQGGGGGVALTVELQPPPPPANAEVETTAPVDRIVERWASDKLARGEQIYDMAKWSAQARERVRTNAQHWPRYIEETLRAMNNPPDAETTSRTLIPAAEALRRLYDAKAADLQRLGVPERDRIPLAVDYACGEVWRCQIQPMPDGGLPRLEDDLYRALGYDRTTGLRFPAPA